MNPDLATLAAWTTVDDWPNIPCPVCLRATLTVQAFEDLPTAKSNMLQQTNDDWEPDWIRGHFRGVLRCHAKRCGEQVLVTGEMEIALAESSSRGGDDYPSVYLLRFALPALPLIQFPDGCPDSVRRHVNQAAALLWADPGAAAGRLRLAIEQLLTELGVAEKRVLADRISEFRETREDVAETLEAVKWIGNQGAHEDTLSVTDVLDGASLLEHALVLLYSQPKIQALAAQINANKGIRRP